MTARPARGGGEKARADRLLAASPIGTAHADAAGAIVRHNRAFALAFVGDAEAQLEGRMLADLIARCDRDDLGRQLSKLIIGAAKTVRIDGVGVDATALAERRLSLLAFTLIGGDGMPAIAVHALEESDRAQGAAALVHAQKMQAVGQLAGGIAHDFNNLLTAMLGFCDLLLGRHGPGDPSFEEISQVRANAVRASDLVRQLLAFSRKQQVKPTAIDPGQALNDLADMLARLLGPAIDLRLELTSDPGQIEADPSQFDQIIINLAVNARDAMPAGGTLTIRSTAIEMAAGALCGGEAVPPGRYIRIDVVDTGVGIPKEIIEHIFEPFFTTKEVGAGTGLGLATVYGLLRQMGGFIAVDSALGEGTRFSVLLPALAGSAASPPARATATPAPAAPAQGASATVLLVDDEDPVRVFAARGLRKRGYRVLEASSGEQALDVLAHHPGVIDVLLTDVVMPGMDGYTLAQLVQRDRPSMRIIAMSGFREDALLEGRTEEVRAGFLAKPFTLAELTAGVDAALSAAGAEDGDEGVRPGS
jgi:two-component system cell cycle sensor histidine kinase/response regulator CckA